LKKGQQVNPDTIHQNPTCNARVVYRSAVDVSIGKLGSPFLLHAKMLLDKQASTPKPVYL
jgi:hypothetical protein